MAEDVDLSWRSAWRVAWAIAGVGIFLSVVFLISRAMLGG